MSRPLERLGDRALSGMARKPCQKSDALEI
jgi:hypothetical protein